MPETIIQDKPQTNPGDPKKSKSQLWRVWVSAFFFLFFLFSTVPLLRSPSSPQSFPILGGGGCRGCRGCRRNISSESEIQIESSHPTLTRDEKLDNSPIWIIPVEIFPLGGGRGGRGGGKRGGLGEG